MSARTATTGRVLPAGAVAPSRTTRTSVGASVRAIYTFPPTLGATTTFSASCVSRPFAGLPFTRRSHATRGGWEAQGAGARGVGPHEVGGVSHIVLRRAVARGQLPSPPPPDALRAGVCYIRRVRHLLPTLFLRFLTKTFLTKTLTKTPLSTLNSPNSFNSPLYSLNF